MKHLAVEEEGPSWGSDFDFDLSCVLYDIYYIYGDRSCWCCDVWCMWLGGDSVVSAETDESGIISSWGSGPGRGGLRLIHLLRGIYR